MVFFEWSDVSKLAGVSVAVAIRQLYAASALLRERRGVQETTFQSVLRARVRKSVFPSPLGLRGILNVSAFGTSDRIAALGQSVSTLGADQPVKTTHSILKAKSSEPPRKRRN